MTFPVPKNNVKTIPSSRGLQLHLPLLTKSIMLMMMMMLLLMMMMILLNQQQETTILPQDSSIRRRLALQSNKPVVYTFYHEFNAAAGGTGMTAAADQELLQVWVDEWSQAGWNPKILNMEDVRQHPQFQTVDAMLDGLPFKYYDVSDEKKTQKQKLLLQLYIQNISHIFNGIFNHVCCFRDSASCVGLQLLKQVEDGWCKSQRLLQQTMLCGQSHPLSHVTFRMAHLSLVVIMTPSPCHL